MGRGEAKRHRQNVALRAKAEKKRLDPNVLLDKTKKSKNKPALADDHMSASMRRFMELKAAGDGKRPPLPAERPAPQQRNKFKRQAVEDGGSRSNPPSDARDADKTEQPPSGKRRRREDPQQISGSLKQAQPSLKPRKKEFLLRKKLKRKGKLAAGDGEESDPEERLVAIAAATKPAFGDQATAPIDANLKRRHWSEGQDMAAERVKKIFLKQMESARRQAGGLEGAGTGRLGGAAAREEAIEAYRAQKRGGAGPPVATMKSLAALVRKDGSSSGK